MIRGIAGFGSGLIAVPLLAHWHPLTLVVPVVLITDFSASLTLGSFSRRDVRWDEIRPLLPWSIIGVLLGTTLLINLPKSPLLATLGLLIAVFGVRYALGLHGTAAIGRAWAGPAGLIGGAVGGLFGTGGPPYVIYLNHRLQDKAELRATFSGLFLLEGGLRIASFLVFGLLLEPAVGLAAVVALPLMALGLWLGHHAHLGISAPQLQRLIGALLLVSGASLLWKAVA